MNVDVLVLGGNMPGVLTAIECAKLGLKVAMVFTELEVPQNPVTDGAGGWSSLMAELELDAPTADVTHQAFVRSAQGEVTAVLPESWLGIPSSPLAAEVVAAVGQAAATRAYLDRIKPVLTIGKVRHLAALVTKRMGAAVLNTLVEPFVSHRFGVDAAHVDVALAAPGLNEAITRTGSLSTGVLATYAALNNRDRTFTLPPATEFAAAIRKRLEFWSVQVVDAQPDEFNLEAADVTYRALVVADTPALANHLIGLTVLGLTELAVRMTLAVTVTAATPVGYRGLGNASDDATWSVAVVAAEGDERSLVLGGPRVLRNLDAAEQADELSEAEVVNIVTAAGIELSGDVQVRSATQQYLPFSTLEEEHAREGICDILGALDAQRVVGRWLYQGDESAAITAAQQQALSLRRQLLGLN